MSVMFIYLYYDGKYDGKQQILLRHVSAWKTKMKDLTLGQEEQVEFR